MKKFSLMLIILFSCCFCRAQNAPFSLWGAGLDGSIYQQSDIYSDATNGFLFEAALNPSGVKLPIEFNWRGGGVPPLKIDPSGNVGIGTRSPSSLLHLSSSNSIDLKMISTAAGGYSRLFFGAGTNGARWNVGQRDDSGGIFSIEGDSNGLGAWGSRLAVTLSGNVGIGTTTPDSKLSVAGTIHSQVVKVDLTGWPDYVFKPSYHLPSLAQVKSFIDLNHHLPDMPSESEVAKDGLNLGEMNKLLTKKMEEMTLYLIEQDEKIKKLEGEVQVLLKNKN